MHYNNLSHKIQDRLAKRPQNGYRVRGIGCVVVARRMYCHERSTCVEAHQKPTLSSLGLVLQVTQPVTSRGRGCFNITSIVGAPRFQLDVPPISPKRLPVVAG